MEYQSFMMSAIIGHFLFVFLWLSVLTGGFIFYISLLINAIIFLPAFITDMILFILERYEAR